MFSTSLLSMQITLLNHFFSNAMFEFFSKLSISSSSLLSAPSINTFILLLSVFDYFNVMFSLLFKSMPRSFLLSHWLIWSVIKRPTDSTTSTTSGETDTTSGQTRTTSGKTSTSIGRRVLQVIRQVIP